MAGTPITIKAESTNETVSTHAINARGMSKRIFHTSLVRYRPDVRSPKEALANPGRYRAVITVITNDDINGNLCGFKNPYIAYVYSTALKGFLLTALQISKNISVVLKNTGK
jgi:hypothetical protein